MNDYEKALAYAKSGDLEKAQALLIASDHPKADALLDRVNKAIAARGTGGKAKPSAEAVKEGLLQYDQERGRRSCMLMLALLGCIVMCAVLLVFQANFG